MHNDDSTYGTNGDDPAAWMYQHDETGITTIVDHTQHEWGFAARNPRYRLVMPLYSRAAASLPLDESQLPVDQQSLIYRLRRRAEIRRGITGRDAYDKISNLLEEAADQIELLQAARTD
jgi:hypothetical protein